MKIKIGCTGWSYEGWVGHFYPRTLDNSKFLKYYSSIFDITEINSTYYRIPNSFMTRKWNNDTPNNFRFSAKFPGKITHEHKLKDVRPIVDEFLTALAPLENKIFALLFQLPPSLKFDDAKPRLDELFSYLPNHFRYPIEGRHESWFTDDAIEYLRKNNHCLVWNEIQGVNNPAPVTSNYVYVRLIGDRSIPESEFGKVVRDRTSEIQKWHDRIGQIQSKVDDVFALTNNHYQGFAPATANQLRTSFGMSELLWEEKKQKKLEF